jgi:hypothetical protein
MANMQTSLYSIPRTAFHDITAGSNGDNATRGYDLVTGLGSPVADQVVAGVLATQGVYTVSGASRLSLPTSFPSTTALPHATLSSGDTGNTGSVTPTPLFPTGDPVVVVVIVPAGSYHVVVFVPITPPPAARSPLAASTHPVETPVLIDIGVPVHTSTPFGQEATVDSVLTRFTRWNSGGDVAAIFDRVEPFQPPAPAPPRDASAPSARTQATTLAMPAATLLWCGRLDDDRAEADAPKFDQEPAVLTAALSASADTENENGEETSLADSSGTLAGTTVLAGTAYWLVFNESDGQKDSRHRQETGSRLKPRVRKCLAPRA